jgi:anti-sigma regulatory factor (Ser/Thr protein kinase)
MTTNTHDELRMRMLASPAAVGLCRTLVEQRLRKWGVGWAISDALLVTGELAANAVDACPMGAEIWIRLSRDAAGILLQVWDPVDRLPEPRTVELALDTLDLDPVNFDDNGGWGLAIVAVLSLDHGCTPHPRGGKTVWASLKV